MRNKNVYTSLNGLSNTTIIVIITTIIVVFTCVSIVQYMHFTEILNQAQIEIASQNSRIEELKKLLEISEMEKNKKIKSDRIFLFLKVAAVIGIGLGAGLGAYKLMSGALLTPYISQITNICSDFGESAKVYWGIAHVERIVPLENGMNAVIKLTNKLTEVFIEIKPDHLVTLNDYIVRLCVFRDIAEKPLIETVTNATNLDILNMASSISII